MKESEHPARSDDEIEISLTDLLLAIWDIRWAAVILMVLGCLAGASVSAGSTVAYSTKASMIVTARNGDGAYQNGNTYPRPDEVYLSQNLAKTVKLLASSDRVLNRVLENGQYPDILPDELRDRIEVTAEDGTSFLWLALSWEKEEEAEKILNRVMEILPEVMRETMDIGDVSVIDYAGQTVKVQKKIPRGGVIGAALGLILGCFAGVLYYLFVPKVRGENSLGALGLDAIGVIPGAELAGSKSCYLDDEGMDRDYLEAYGRLSVVFRYLAGQKGKKIIAVTSSISGEGKSTVAYNLALRLTETGNRVLLLDFDFKKGVLYQLTRARKPKDGDVRTESRNAGELDGMVEKLYNGIYTIQGFQENDVFQVNNKIFPAIRKLKEEFDFILIDTPPVGELSDVQYMRELVEGILLVVREDIARMGSVSKSAEYLNRTGIEVIGCVLNGRKRLFPGVSP